MSERQKNPTPREKAIKKIEGNKDKKKMIVGIESMLEVVKESACAKRLNRLISTDEFDNIEPTSDKDIVNVNITEENDVKKYERGKMSWT